MKTPDDYLKKTLGDRFGEFKQKSTYYCEVVDAIKLIQQDIKNKRLEKASIKAMQGLLSNTYIFRFPERKDELAKELSKQLDEL